MKLLADSMLGRLARWLRMSGYDTLYFKQRGDEDLISIAANENRILLTRDAKLHAKARKLKLQSCLVSSGDLMEQLKQLIAEFGVVIQNTPQFARCSECNGEIERAEKSVVKGKIPGTVFETVDEFYICVDCGKIYWQGSHWRKIREAAKRLRGG